MDLRTFKNRIGKLGPRPGPQRKSTTVETRQELDRFLAEIASRPIPAVAPKRSEAEEASLAAAQAEVARVLGILDRLYPPKKLATEGEAP
jgi:hypothetical protein